MVIYIFRDRHIKNVSANKLDSEKQLPSEMMVGAREKILVQSLR